MPTKSSQPPNAMSQKKSKSSKINTVKFDALPSSSSSLKRLNPLTAFAKPPAFDIDGEPRSQGDAKGKGKARSKSSATPQIRSARDDRLWVDRYEPTNEAELAVHNRKVEDVRRWLSEALEGGPSGKLKKYRRILALTGPAGTGKTTTVRVLAREMGFEILEWRSGVTEQLSNDYDEIGGGNLERPQDYYQNHEALISKFQAFLARASTCQNIFTTPASASSSSDPRCLSQPSLSYLPSQSQSKSRTTINSAQTRVLPSQIILLEDFPNVLHPYTQSQFQASLRSLVDSPSATPVIIIVSDAGMRGEASDERMASGGGWGKDKDGVLDIRTVLSRELLNGPYVTQIGFNPIAPTLMRRALQALLNAQFSSASGSSLSEITTIASPSKDFLDLIVESANGDIRSAIMALQFACVIELPQETKGKGRKKTGKDGGSGARVVLEAVTRREQSLALFHLIGKVMYNKRKGDPSNPTATAKDIKREKDLDAQLKDPPKMPWFLSEHDRRASRVNVDMLYADSPIDSSLFSLYIHQNYSQFCNDIAECESIAEWLSWVDSSGGEAWYQANPHRFHLLTLGTLHSLPSPVTRRSQKIFKPEFFDVLKKENDAWEAVRDVRDWIATEKLGKEMLEQRAALWSKINIAMELGGVLKAKDAVQADKPPSSHRLFSNLTFSFGKNAIEGMQQIGEGDVDEELELAEEQFDCSGDRSDTVKPCGGWLENDDIEDFD